MPSIDPTTAATFALEENLGVVSNFLQSATTQLNVALSSSRPSPLSNEAEQLVATIKLQLTQLTALVNLIG